MSDNHDSPRPKDTSPYYPTFHLNDDVEDKIEAEELLSRLSFDNSIGALKLS